MSQTTENAFDNIAHLEADLWDAAVHKRRHELENLFNKRLTLDHHGYEIGNYFTQVLMQ
ncbi:MAG: hypothetical protein HY343_13070 [Lentisphaerae bacterium]|nr:hypothetical protein [Lentisphaerota bacterium]